MFPVPTRVSSLCLSVYKYDHKDRDAEIHREKMQLNTEICLNLHQELNMFVIPRAIMQHIFFACFIMQLATYHMHKYDTQSF